MTPNEIFGAVQGLKGAFDILQGLNATAKEAAINEVKVSLTRHIIEAQQALTAAGLAQADAAEKIRTLEQEIVSLKHWEREKERYQLSGIGTVGFAYTPKEGMEGGEPMHWLCQPCFDTGHKSVLQFTEVTSTSGGRGMKSSWKCSRCSSVMKAGMSAKPSDPSTW